MGRPRENPSDKVNLTFLEELVSLGLTNEQISGVLGVSQTTFYNWLAKNDPRFLESIKKGEERRTKGVGESLYQRATGYTFDEVTRELRKMGRTKEGENIYADELVVSKIVTKH